MTFGKADSTSKFLTFNRAEYHRRGTQHRKELSDKTHVHSLLKDVTIGGERIRLPQQHAVVTRTEDITSELIGERAALKFAHGWSAKGVMLLESTGEDRYFDHMALREWTIEAIREHQAETAARFSRKEPAWIVEDLLRGPQPGTIPYDYKFYVFQGRIGMIAQVDRNSTPPRVVMFDGDLNPMTPGQDYRLRPKDLQTGVHIVPRSALMLSRWAMELSTMTDAPCVRVDLYDTDQGPCFGEFTFSSGADARGTITYSEEVLHRLDALYTEAEKTLAGEPAEPPQGWSGLLQDHDDAGLAAQPQIPLQEYERYAYVLHNRGNLGGTRLAQAQERVEQQDADPAISQHLAEAHRETARRARSSGGGYARGLVERAARKAYREIKNRTQR